MEKNKPPSLYMVELFALEHADHFCSDGICLNIINFLWADVMFWEKINSSYEVTFYTVICKKCSTLLGCH